jgi:hypothetical protein
MKKIILLCIVTLIALSAFAQSPRLMSMGHVYGYIADDNDIFMYPATIHKYGNTVYGYLGSGSGDTNNYNFGMNYNMNDMVIGAYFNKPIPWFANPINIGLVNVTMDKRFQMFLGFNENMALDLTLAMDHYAEPVASLDDDDTESFMMFGLGFGYSTDKMDTGFHFTMPMLSSETFDGAGNSVEMSENKMAFDLSGRMSFTQIGSMDLIGLLNFDFVSSTFDDGNDATDDVKDGYMGLELGVGGLIKADDNNTIVLGVTPFAYNLMSYDDGTNNDTATNITIPAFNVGLESQLCNWLIVRAGAEQSYMMTSITNDDGTNETTTSTWDSFFTYNMGMGVMYKNFTVDFVFNEDFLHNGPNFITGQNTADLAAELMIKYKF